MTGSLIKLGRKAAKIKVKENSSFKLSLNYNLLNSSHL